MRLSAAADDIYVQGLNGTDYAYRLRFSVVSVKVRLDSLPCRRSPHAFLNPIGA